MAAAATSQESVDVGEILSPAGLVVNVLRWSPAHLTVGMLVQIEPPDNLVFLIFLPLRLAYRS
jgi:hypothetical protein